MSALDRVFDDRQPPLAEARAPVSCRTNCVVRLDRLLTESGLDEAPLAAHPTRGPRVRIKLHKPEERNGHHRLALHVDSVFAEVACDDARKSNGAALILPRELCRERQNQTLRGAHVLVVPSTSLPEVSRHWLCRVLTMYARQGRAIAVSQAAMSNVEFHVIAAPAQPTMGRTIADRLGSCLYHSEQASKARQRGCMPPIRVVFLTGDECIVGAARRSTSGGARSAGAKCGDLRQTGDPARTG